MKDCQIYDLPTRLFHWVFASMFIMAFLIAKTVDDESIYFSYHMFAGFMLCFAVLLRLAWGFMGTQYALFSSFSLNPLQLFSYIKGVLSGSKEKWIGHNPASSWAAIIMMFLGLGLGVSGYFMTTGQNKEEFEEVHELFANGFMIVAAMHILGIIIHTISHRDMIGFTMIHGCKSHVPNDKAISSTRPFVALIFLMMLVLFGAFLNLNFNKQSGTLNIFGTSLQLGENEENEDEDEGEGEIEKDEEQEMFNQDSMDAGVEIELDDDDEE